MGIMTEYLRNLRLQFNIGMTVSATYHLNSREANRELKVSVDNSRPLFQKATNYLGARLDRTLNFKQHIEEIVTKVTFWLSRSRCLSGITWGGCDIKLRIYTRVLVFSAAECRAIVDTNISVCPRQLGFSS